MALTMQPSRRLTDGTINSYVVQLPNGATAFLNSVSGRGWELIIRRGGGATDRRGLFASHQDIMLVLQAEVDVPQPSPTWPEVERRSRPRL
jgi:hypothetical protein